jgi:hypothetical protein
VVAHRKMVREVRARRGAFDTLTAGSGQVPPLFCLPPLLWTAFRYHGLSASLSTSSIASSSPLFTRQQLHNLPLSLLHLFSGGKELSYKPSSRLSPSPFTLISPL